MPKVRMNAREYALQDFVRNMNAHGYMVGANNKKELAARLGMNYDRLLYIQKKPDSLTLLELVEIIDALKLEPDALSMLFRHGKVR